MRTLKNLKHNEAIKLEQIERFRRVVAHLDGHPVPGDFPKPREPHDLKKDENPYYTLEDAMPPSVIYYASQEVPWDILNSTLSVGITGCATRKDGRKYTWAGRQLSKLLAESTVKYGRESDIECLVVTGGAYGIDGAANEGAFGIEGRTVAAIANPVENGMYPRDDRRKGLRFEEKLLDYGGLVSEQTEYTDPTMKKIYYKCIARDRIISALSDILVIVECRELSGSVDTAYKAMFQGVPVVVVDWSKIGDSIITDWYKKRQSKKPEEVLRDGNDMLLKGKSNYPFIPDSFPKSKVDNISDLRDSFIEYLSNIRPVD